MTYWQYVKSGYKQLFKRGIESIKYVIDVVPHLMVIFISIICIFPPFLLIGAAICKYEDDRKKLKIKDSPLKKYEVKKNTIEYFRCLCEFNMSKQQEYKIIMSNAESIIGIPTAIKTRADVFFLTASGQHYILPYTFIKEMELQHIT